MNTLTTVCQIIAEVLDIEPEGLTEETYLMRDLPTESIDLLEYGVGINKAFRIPVKDNILFLTDLRVLVEQAQSSALSPIMTLQSHYPHISSTRLAQMVNDIEDGPVMQICDIVSYIRHSQQ